MCFLAVKKQYLKKAHEDSQFQNVIIFIGNSRYSPLGGYFFVILVSYIRKEMENLFFKCLKNRFSDRILF